MIVRGSEADTPYLRWTKALKDRITAVQSLLLGEANVDVVTDLVIPELNQDIGMCDAILILGKKEDVDD